MNYYVWPSPIYVPEFVWCSTARQHRKVDFFQLREGETDSAAKYGQRDTMHNSSHVTQLQCNTVHSRTLQLQNCNNQLSNRMTYLLKYYVSAFTNTKSDQPLPIWYNFTRCGSVLRHAQDIV